MQNPNITPWPCPKCGKVSEWIYDDQDKRIGWICYGCSTGEDYTADQKQPRPRTHWRNIDDQDDQPHQEPDSGIL